MFFGGDNRNFFYVKTQDEIKKEEEKKMKYR